MKHFQAMIQQLSQTSSKLEKIAAMRDFLVKAPHEIHFSDCAWVVRLLCGEKAGKSISRVTIREALSEYSGYDKWMVDVCYSAAGDFGDTISKIIPRRLLPACSQEKSLTHLILEDLLPLAYETKEKQKLRLKEVWSTLTSEEIYLYHKLMSGTLRVGVARGLVIEALNEVYAHLSGQAATETTQSQIAHRLTAIPKTFASERAASDWYQSLISEKRTQIDVTRPYPFCLAHPLEKDALTQRHDFSSLGAIEDWQLEWKWDGIRAQMIHRDSRVTLWSRGEEEIAGSFPELLTDGQCLPEGTVLDGEILAYPLDTVEARQTAMTADISDAIAPLTFNDLQKRLNRKMKQAGFWPMVPVVFLAYDLLEVEGEDIRKLSQENRRQKLNELFASHLLPHYPLLIRKSPLVKLKDWDELKLRLTEAKERGVEGLMLKSASSVYASNRQRGTWWKLKTDPYTIDAVLIAAEPGHGKRAGLHSRFSLGLMDDRPEHVSQDDQFDYVTVAKAYSGLTDEELLEMDEWIRANTVARYGSQRLVQPVHVFEIAFQSVQTSKRHKSGVALRFPRIHRWRKDKTCREIDTLCQLKRLISE